MHKRPKLAFRVLPVVWVSLGFSSWLLIVWSDWAVVVAYAVCFIAAMLYEALIEDEVLHGQ